MRRTSFPLSLLLMIAAVIIAAMIAVTSASAQTAPPQWKIAFISFSGACGNSYDTCLSVVNADGTNLVNLTGIVAGGDPVWSPDGGQLAFTSSGYVFVIPADGGTAVNLTSNLTPDNRPPSPAWSPDGTKIAFTNQGWILVVPASGGTAVTLTDKLSNASPAWSPDGTKIAFSSNRDYGSADYYARPYELYIMNADGSAATRLTTGVDVYDRPRWSPDGSRIVFSCFVSGSNSSDICAINPDGSRFAVLTTDDLGDVFPDWSPDGSKIVYFAVDWLGSPCPSGGAVPASIRVMNADGSNGAELAGTFTYAADGPTWSRDGNQIAFSSGWTSSSCQGFPSSVDVMNADGTGLLWLASGSGPVWQPSTNGSLNNPPIPSFTYACNGLTCSFDASASRDQDGTISKYDWSLGDGKSDSGPTVTHTYATGGTYTVTLTVTDDHGGTGVQSNLVTVTAPNVPPVAAFTFACSSLACNFDGSGSRDSDGTITRYSWDFGNGATASGATVAYTYAAGGTYTVTLTVTDNSGATGSQSNAVTVTAPNLPPLASFTFSCTRLTCSFDGSASRDSDGWITQYAWNFGDGATGSGSVATIKHNYAGPGAYAVTLTVTDNSGATGAQANNVTVTRRK